MQKTVGCIFVALCLCGSVCAVDTLVATGRVAEVRAGQASMFYSLEATDGQVYEANSAWSQIAENAEQLQAAYDSAEYIVIEFRSHPKHSNSIWKIKSIKILTPKRPSPNSRPPTPNVLLIISDDQGIGDFGFMGNQMVKTPNLDRLASESAVFRELIVAPACSPSRASLMTGRNHMKTGVWGVGDRNNFMRDEIIMPQFFKDAGYHTGYFGKRDGTYSVELEAWDRGCDEVTHVTGYQHKDPLTFTQKGVVKRAGWTCDLDTAAALDFIERQGDEPWWVAVPYLLPHLPWVADQKFVQPYLDAGCSHKLADVYGCITQMDAAIGDLLTGVERMGQAENTIVLFLSDNGPSYKGMSEADIASRNPLGLKGHKADAWENGIVVPFLVKWPGKIPPGERTQFATVEDVLPTVLDLAGIPQSIWPEHRPFDGISLCDALETPAAPTVEREVFRVAISGHGQAGGGRWIVNDPQEVTLTEQHTVLSGPRFKLHNLVGGETVLFDVQADPGESNDVSAQYPEIAQRYRAELEREYAEIQATERTYQMSKTKVGKKAFRYNKIEAALMKRMFGSIQPVPPRSITGFADAGDRAEYGIIIEDAGIYTVEVRGKNVTNSRGWILNIGGDSIPLLEATEEKLVFGPAKLAHPGEAGVAVSVNGFSTSGAVVDSIVFSLNEPSNQYGYVLKELDHESRGWHE